MINDAIRFHLQFPDIFEAPGPDLVQVAVEEMRVITVVSTLTADDILKQDPLNIYTKRSVK